MQNDSRSNNSGKLVAVIRIRGRAGIRRKFETTLNLLNLHKPNHVTLLPLTASYKGMLQKIRHLIAWGEPSFDTLLQLLRQRGKVVNDGDLNDELVKEKSRGKYQNITELTEAIWEKKSLQEIEWLRPVFRLHPPVKGFKNIKKSFEGGGSYGYWGKDIDRILKRMI